MRPFLFRPILLLLLCLAWPVESFADIAVIVNKKNPLNALNSKEISNIYLGRSLGFQIENNQLPAVVFDQASDAVIRKNFFQAINGMSIERLNAYWARLTFSGQVLPPRSLNSSHDVILAVRRLPNAIGYIESNLIDDSVKVLLLIKVSP